MGDPSERTLAHRVSSPVKVFGVVRPPAPSGGYCPKGNPSEREVSAANCDCIVSGAAMIDIALAQ